MTALESVIICTYNRPEEVQRLAGELAQQTAPVDVILVDAGSDLDYEANDFTLRSTFPASRYLHLASEPSLPHQRQFGVLEALKRNPEATHLHFLDDDVSIAKDYIAKMTAIMASLGSLCVVLGPRDASLSRKKSFGWFRFAWLDGRLLKSGLYFAVRDIPTLKQVDWLPGNAWTVSVTVFESFSFFDYGNFFAEDLAACLAWQSLGPLWSTPNVTVHHRESAITRPNERESILLTRLAIWDLAGHYPQRLSRSWILVAEIPLLAKNILLWALFPKKRGSFRDRFLGHSDFLQVVGGRILGK